MKQKPITIKARSITPTLEAARELVKASAEIRLAPKGCEKWEDLIAAESGLASLLGLERDEETGRYRDG